MNITQKKSPNITKGRNGYKPDIIVCHITEGSYAGAVSWLCNKTSGASTHYVIAKDGRVTQLVDLKDTAWGNGTTTAANDSRFYGNSVIKAVRDRKTSANNYTISIEHEGFFKDAQGALTEAQLSAAVDVIAHIRAEVKRIYGITIPIDKEHIVGHCHIAPKWKPSCPGGKYPFDNVIAQLIQREKVANETVSSDNESEGEEMVKRYNQLDELPEWAKGTVKKLIEKGFLAGDGSGLDLTLDMIRMLVINDRASIYGE